MASPLPTQDEHPPPAAAAAGESKEEDEARFLAEQEERWAALQADRNEAEAAAAAKGRQQNHAAAPAAMAAPRPRHDGDAASVSSAGSSFSLTGGGFSASDVSLAGLAGRAFSFGLGFGQAFALLEHLHVIDDEEMIEDHDGCDEVGEHGSHDGEGFFAQGHRPKGHRCNRHPMGKRRHARMMEHRRQLAELESMEQGRSGASAAAAASAGVSGVPGCTDCAASSAAAAGSSGVAATSAAFSGPNTSGAVDPHPGGGVYLGDGLHSSLAHPLPHHHPHSVVRSHRPHHRRRHARPGIHAPPACHQCMDDGDLNLHPSPFSRYYSPIALWPEATDLLAWARVLVVCVGLPLAQVTLQQIGALLAERAWSSAAVRWGGAEPALPIGQALPAAMAAAASSATPPTITMHVTQPVAPPPPPRRSQFDSPCY